MLKSVLLPLLFASAEGTRSTSTLLFSSPTNLSLSYPDGVPNSQAMFGTPSYGHAAAITGQLIYANQDDEDACSEFSAADIAAWPVVPGMPIILMADRGTCNFVEKVRHAQNAGAHAAIIVDNKDEPNLPLMADDNTGADIQIPSILVHKDDGGVIKSYMTQKPQVTLAWNLPHPDGRVEWSFWTSSFDTSAASFKTQFDLVTKSLGTTAQLTPHYFFLGTEIGCLDSTNPICLSACINNGRYCAPDPEKDISLGLSGKMIVEENLRQMCLWQTHLADDEDPQMWFDYVTGFEEKCKDNTTWNKACSDGIINGLGLDAAAVGACVTEQMSNSSGYVKMIDAEMKEQYDMGVYFKPTITINNVQYRGSLSCPAPVKRATCGVLGAICAGFADETAPDTCVDTDCPLGQKRDACNVCGGSGEIDACGKCFASANSSGFNTVCVKGCDGIVNSGKVKEDVCNRCGVTADKCGTCLPVDAPQRIEGSASCEPVQAAQGVPVWAVVLIVILVVGVVGVVVFITMSRRETRQRQDIDDLLAQYLPMDQQGKPVQTHKASRADNGGAVVDL